MQETFDEPTKRYLSSLVAIKKQKIIDSVIEGMTDQDKTQAMAFVDREKAYQVSRPGSFRRSFKESK